MSWMSSKQGVASIQESVSCSKASASTPMSTLLGLATPSLNGGRASAATRLDGDLAIRR